MEESYTLGQRRLLKVLQSRVLILNFYLLGIHGECSFHYR